MQCSGSHFDVVVASCKSNKWVYRIMCSCLPPLIDNFRSLPPSIPLGIGCPQKKAVHNSSYPFEKWQWMTSVKSFIHIEMGNQDYFRNINRLPSSSLIPWFTLHNDYSKLLPREHFCRKSKWMSIYPFMNETVCKHCTVVNHKKGIWPQIALQLFFFL